MVIESPASAAAPMKVAVKVDQLPGVGVTPVAGAIILGPISKSADPAKGWSNLAPRSTARIYSIPA